MTRRPVTHAGKARRGLNISHEWSDQIMKQTSLNGKTFGHWKIRNDYICENNKRKWLCECRCGTVRYVNEHNLLSGKSKSCGCLSAELSKERIKDLTGQKFGWLKVIKRAPENRHGRVSWVCECKCGNTCIVTGHELQQKKTRSCGCLKKEHTTAVDLTDWTFGRLRARHPTGERDHKGSIIWHCTCSCGGEIDVTQDRLMSKNTKSCGCLKKEAQANLPGTLHHMDGTCVEFLKRRQRSDNTSGHTGVYRLKNGRCRAVIGFKGRRLHLGNYDTFEEAVKVREHAKDALHNTFIEQYDQWQAGASRVRKKETPKHPALLSG